MFKRLLGLGRDSNREVTDALYGQIVAAARQPAFYAEWEAPDTPLGRFELLSVHMFLFLHRSRAASPALRDAAQELTDEFFKDVDHSLRELGIGDMGVPKRMKKLAKMFYGRAESYGAALEAGDRSALAAALARNVRPDLPGWKGAKPVADYMLAAHALLKRQQDEALLAGRLEFPVAAAGEEAA